MDDVSMTSVTSEILTEENMGSVWSTLRHSMSEQSAVSLLGVGAAMGVGAAAVYFANKGGLKLKAPVELTDQSVRYEASSDEHSRVSRLVGPKGQLMERQFEDATTLYEGFRRGARESKTGECIGYRDESEEGAPYKWITYQHVIDRAAKVAKGFVTKGLEVGQQSFVGIYSNNRPEWIYTEQACYNYSMVIVPLYDTLGPEACAFIINQADIKLVVVDKAKKIKALLKHLVKDALLEQHDDCKCLKTIVLMETPPEDMVKQAKAQNMDLISFEDLEKAGEEMADAPQFTPPEPKHLATICYTSGTTGNPKGVMLTHGNIIADVTAMAQWRYCSVQSDDTMMSFLPLAHMFERILEAGLFMVGAKIGFFRGDIKLLNEDIKALRPTILPVVPRLLNRIYDKVMSEVEKSGLKKMLFKWALSSKGSELKRSIIRNDGVWDRLVFKKVREGMGGRVRLMVTGSAPLSETVLTFIRAAMGCVVLEGYGQTECVACATVTMEGDHTPGQVGPPIPCCEIKLADVPDMNYFANQNKGEVCIRGPNVSQGYFKDPEKTKETIDEDGWLHTGDVGMWTETGTLKIVDRKKHIFKLAQGEYVAPEKIENVYTRSKYIAQLFVHGESLKSCLIAIVVPDMEVLPADVKKHLGIEGTPQELCDNERVKKLILDDMNKVGKHAGLHSFEQVKDIFLFPELFSVENNLLTPTFKAKRPQLKDFFSAQLTKMYSALM